MQSVILAPPFAARKAQGAGRWLFFPLGHVSLSIFSHAPALLSPEPLLKVKNLYNSTILPCHALALLLYSWAEEEWNTMLTIENVSKRYGKTLANDGVSFAVGEGGTGRAAGGPNGAGEKYADQVYRRAFAL